VYPPFTSNGRNAAYGDERDIVDRLGDVQGRLS
jgi:hypothetical protein